MEQADTSANDNANDSASQPSENKTRRRANPEAVKASKASDIAKSEIEANAAGLVANTAAHERDKNHKKQAAKKKTQAKKKISSKTSKKTKAKAKKTSTKSKTKSTKSKSTAFSQPTKEQKNLTSSADTGQEKGAASDEERSPKTSVKMTVVNIDETPTAKTKKKGWWSR